MSSVITYVVPTLGSILGVAMYSSSLPEIYRIYKKQDLGSFNPTPFALQILNATAWCTYGHYLATPTNAFIFYPNWYGIITGILVLGICFPLASKQAQKKMIGALLFLVVVFYFFAFTVHIAVDDAQVKETALGSFAVVIQLAFFGSPLETMITVIKNKDASSIYWPLSLVTVINSGFWSVYGVALKNTFIAFPNIMTHILGWIQVILCLVYRQKRALVDSAPAKLEDQPHAFDKIELDETEAAH
jgi:solute carrier family 50 protein (sugar transporter)